MPPVNPELVEAFSAKAALDNTVMQELPTMAAALQYVVDVCEKKAPAELLADEPSAEKGPLGPNKVPTRVKRIVAAPGLSDEDFATLSAACEAKGFACLREGLRNHLAGIDVGFSCAEAVRKMPEEVRSSAASCLRTTRSAKGLSFIIYTSKIFIYKIQHR